MAQLVPRKVQMSVKIHIDEGAYKMVSCNRGVLLLVNIIDFPDPQSKRSGAETDSMSLQCLFVELGFRVVIHENLSQQGFFNVLSRLTSSSDVKEAECFVLVLMSHGTRVNDIDKVIFSDGSMVDIQRIENHFRADNCPHLVGKPKVLIFPFCRGDRLDKGFPRPGTSDSNLIEMESACFTSSNVPTLADTIICYGNTAGFLTHRDLKSGNWYIQKFCDIMAKYAYNTHLEDILKKTQAEADADAEADAEAKAEADENPGPDQTLQIGSFVNIGFNKKLYFNPGVYIRHYMVSPSREVQKSVKIHTDEVLGVYKMESRNRGVLLLVNIIDFPDPKYTRKGAEIDSKSLQHLFERMDFKVCSHDNLSEQEFFDVLDTLTSSSYVKETECFVLVLMSHGFRVNETDKVMFNDGSMVDLESIINRFLSKDCPNLAGKPKVMFFPFSTGTKPDRWFQVFRVPLALMDYMICCGSSPTFSHEKFGNCFIQTFCDVMAKHAHNTHFHDILAITHTELENQLGYFGSMQTVTLDIFALFKRLYFNPGFYRD